MVEIVIVDIVAVCLFLFGSPVDLSLIQQVTATCLVIMYVTASLYWLHVMFTNMGGFKMWVYRAREDPTEEILVLAFFSLWRGCLIAGPVLVMAGSALLGIGFFLFGIAFDRYSEAIAPAHTRYVAGVRRHLPFWDPRTFDI